MPFATSAPGLVLHLYVYRRKKAPKSFNKKRDDKVAVPCHPLHLVTLSPCHFVLSSLRQIVLEERIIRKQVERVGHILDKETAEILQRVAFGCRQLADVCPVLVVDDHA